MRGENVVGRFLSSALCPSWIATSIDDRGAYQRVPATQLLTVASDDDDSDAAGPGARGPSRSCGVAVGMAMVACGAVAALVMPRPASQTQEAPVRRDQGVPSPCASPCEEPCAPPCPVAEPPRYSCQTVSDGCAVHAETASWPEDKRTWCCEQAHIGCAKAAPEPCAQSAPTAYDCRAGLTNWERGWSDTKKRYCCETSGAGCPLTTPRPRGCVGCGDELYDCQAGLTNWERGWSDAKKSYCCAASGAGCPVTTTHPQLQGCNGCAGGLYDCEAGLAHWERGWSQGKKEWCCSHKGTGCAVRRDLECAGDHPHPACGYDCNLAASEWETQWSPAKKTQCCHTVGRGCPEPAKYVPKYDCDVDSVMATTHWDGEKRDWCCKHEGKACPVGATRSFDCYAGYAMWRTGWSIAKQNWCCLEAGRGCRVESTTTASFDCWENLRQWTTAWSPAKKRFCCEHAGMGCATVVATSGPPEETTTTVFAPAWDCDTTFPDAENAWDSVKRAWCCQYRAKGCLGGGKPAACSTLACPAGWVKRVEELYCHGAVCSMKEDLPTCCTQSPVGPPRPTGASCSTFTCPPGYFAKEDYSRRVCLGFPCDVATDTLLCCNQALKCDLNCYGDGAKPVALAGATGSGDDLMLSGITLKECKRECGSSPECEGVVFGEAGGQCFGKKDIHTSMCQPGGGYVTEVLKARPWGKCVLMGDPHVIPFDRPCGPVLDEVTPGDYWLLRSPELRIQGRFGTTKRFPDQASTIGIAVAGPLLGDGALTVEYVGKAGAEGHKGFLVSWRGTEIFADKTKTEDAFRSGEFEATYGSMNPDKWHRDARHTIGGNAGNLPSYLFRFPTAHVNIYLLIGPDNFNAIIEAKKAPGSQDGLCGNFNCQKEDDSEEALKDRGIGSSLPKAESMFSGLADQTPPAMLRPIPGRPKNPLDACDPAVRSAAEVGCSRLPTWQQESCVYDACARNSVDLVKQDLMIGALEEQLDHREIERGW